ncbi:MAG: GNAT family N-acetyltransferase [Clostridia bacterium]|nr:GNAT family N-acetyltransferase [Clostridia bacterium]
MVKVFTVGQDLDTDSAFALHNACFGDEREWFDAFLSAARGQQYIAFCKDEEYIGGMFLLDVFFGEYKGKYVYALGTMPSHRGQGVARALLEKAKELSKDFTLICAADKRLAATYEKHGFDRYVGGTVKAGDMRGADIDTSAYNIPCTYADIRGGLLLNEKLFEFALGGSCCASLYTNGKEIVAKSGAGVYAAYGISPLVAQKAQLYLKQDIDFSGACADLILETV